MNPQGQAGDQNPEENEGPKSMIKFRRDQYRVEIRRERVKELISSRRFKSAEDDEEKDNDIADNLSLEHRLEHLQKFMSDFRTHFDSGNLESLLLSVKGIRKLFGHVEEEAATVLAKSDILPELLRLLDLDKSEELLYEASWVLINYTSTKKCDVLSLWKNDIALRLYGLLEKQVPRLQNHVLFSSEHL